MQNVRVSNFSKINSRKIAKKIELEGEKNSWESGFPKKAEKRHKNKSVSILDYMAQKYSAKIAWSGEMFHW